MEQSKGAAAHLNRETQVYRESKGAMKMPSTRASKRAPTLNVLRCRTNIPLEPTWFQRPDPEAGPKDVDASL